MTRRAPPPLPDTAPTAPTLAALVAQAGELRAGGDLVAAEALLRQAVQRAPGSAVALTNHGLLLSELGRHRDGAARQREALVIDPGLAAAWSNLALALRQLGDVPGAVDAEAQAHQLAPGTPHDLVARGLSLRAGLQLTDALACLRQALRLDARLPEAWINLGGVLQDLGDTSAARTAFEQAAALAPRDRRALANLLMASQYDANRSAGDLRATAARAAAAWPSTQARPRQPPRPPPQPPPSARPLAHGPPDAVVRPSDGRLRLAYLSGDLYAHPVAWLLAPVLEAHDRAVVELHCFDHQARNLSGDPMHQRLRAAVEHWHGVADLDDGAIAARIRHAGIDVLVDLSGHTEHGRLGVVALRPAPVQLSWLGYFGSTGLPAIDAVLLGDALAPAGSEAFYTEPLDRVTGVHFAYAPPPYAPPVAAPPSAHNGVITFGSFNNPAKFGDDVVQLWSAVLQAVPHSRLVLKWKTFADPGFALHIQQRFAACGIDPARVQPRPATPHAQMLAEYGDIDVALDPHPFSGLITTLEALWMGVPVVTLPWQRPVSRQSLAVLRAIGLDRGIATTPRGYVAQAAALAADISARTTWRSGGADSLRHRVSASPLADGRRLAAELEAIYRRHLATRRAASPR